MGTLPTVVKTWQLSINQAVGAQGTATNTMAATIIKIKNVMKGFGTHPWTCTGSSNAGGTTLAPTGGSGLDGSDRWATNADVATGGSNGRHAWIVLRQTGISSTFEVCFDFANTGSLNSGTFVMSPSAGFTGGSATARPTATDEVVLQSASTWTSGVDAQHQVHGWQSTDGQCTRIIVWRASTNLCTYMLFDKIQNPNTTWPTPAIGTTAGATSGIAITYSNLTTGSLSGARSSTATLLPRYSGESDNSGNFLPNTTGVGTVVNDFDSNWPIFPVGLFTTSVTGRGRQGNIFDLWWRPTTVADGDTFPNNASTRQFVAMGPLILPWTGDSTTATLT